jgi:hypothetical protein
MKLNKYDIKNEIIIDNKPNLNLIPRVCKDDDNKDEWVEILRASGLSPDELERLSKNKLFSHLVEAIELLSRLLIDKNMHIRLLDKENDTLNQKNECLYKANCDLLELNAVLKEKIDKYLGSYKVQDEEYQVIKYNFRI